MDAVELVNKARVEEKESKKEHCYSLYIVDDQGDVSTTKAIDEEIERNPEKYTYKTKYPNEDLDKVMKEYEEEFLDDVPVSDTIIEDVTDFTGWDKELVTKILRPSLPDIIEYDQNGEFYDYKWGKIKNDLNLDPRINSMIDSVDASFKLLREQADNFDTVVKNVKSFDWQKVEEEKGEENALYERERFRKIFIKNFKFSSKEEVSNNFKRMTSSGIDECRDVIIDTLPIYKDLRQKSRNIGRQLELDSEGVPVWDYFSLEFIDNFYPEIRDQILVEIDNFDFDVEYKDQFKQLSHQNPSELFDLVSPEAGKKSVEQVANIFFSGFEDTTEDKKSQVISKKMHELTNTIEGKGVITQAIGKLKSQLEYVEEITQTTQKEEKQDLSSSAAILEEIGVSPDGKMVIVKDWKHKPHEIVENTAPKEE